MDFYLACPPCLDCEMNYSKSSIHVGLLERLGLLVATLIELDGHGPRGTSVSSRDVRGFGEIKSLLEAIRVAAQVVQESVLPVSLYHPVLRSTLIPAFDRNTSPW